MNTNKIQNIKRTITNFDPSFNDTAADSCAFNKVLNSGLLSDMIATYLSRDIPACETPDAFTDRISFFAIECVNQIYKPYGRIVREEEVFHEYFENLMISLVKTT